MFWTKECAKWIILNFSLESAVHAVYSIQLRRNVYGTTDYNDYFI